jgi:beta-glucosidase-like glycosyl hydrolase
LIEASTLRVASSVLASFLGTNPSAASDFLLNDLLRSAWNFKGYVTSDCGAIKDIWFPTPPPPPSALIDGQLPGRPPPEETKP